MEAHDNDAVRLISEPKFIKSWEETDYEPLIAPISYIEEEDMEPLIAPPVVVTPETQPFDFLIAEPKAKANNSKREGRKARRRLSQKEKREKSKARKERRQRRQRRQRRANISE